MGNYEGRSNSVISEATSLRQELNIKFPDAAPARANPSQDRPQAKENILRQRFSSLTRSTSQITVKVGKKISSVSPLKTDLPWWKKIMFIFAMLFLGNLVAWPLLWQKTTTPHPRTPDGKVLVDSVKIHSDACHRCPADKEKLAVRLKGERTSEYEDGIPCLTRTF